ncbi:hypothetical protein [Caproiciproducens faecalis]|uniref:Uncharacterized protein n=1 Tax=Caproiciproducens faecalis TaxID=2820301 RepID=A0ABS7DNC0_9FIRM|nr:hypothetical protein [Caproiciproducens faecalis]MBW7572609.1 hypothetical protein [Caproiciproducens faecalis]
MNKKYSIKNMNGDTNNDGKKCGLTDMNCLGQNVNSAYPQKDEENSSYEWNTGEFSTREGKDYIEATPDDEIPDNNR